MPHGFFTLEQWIRQPSESEPRWIPVCHVDASQTLSDAIQRLEDLGKPGFYRVIQTQRMIWAEAQNGKLRLRKWHAGSAKSLSRTAAAFERDKGKWPVSSIKNKCADKSDGKK